MRTWRFVPSFLMALMPAVLSADSSLGRLEGDWDMVIESPERPWIFQVRFQPNGTAWTGTMRVEGLGEFPLESIEERSGHIQFQLPGGLGVSPFTGELHDGTILGQVHESGKTVQARLTRIVPLPKPADRIEAWRQDIEFLSDRLPRYDRSFTVSARDSLRIKLAELEHSLPDLDDDTILVALSRIVALGNNAHTRLRLDPTPSGAFSTQFPIRIWLFEDGPFVIRAAPEYARALSCRVVAINGQPIAKIIQEAERLLAGNASWRAYLAPIYLESPNVLHGIGVIRNASEARFTFEDPDGKHFELDIRPRVIGQTWETWQELSPVFPADSLSATALSTDAGRLPLYLGHPQTAYWFDYLAAERLLYFQFNRSDDDTQGPTFKQFGDSLLAFAGSHPVETTVVDLRLNSGGNLDVAREFMKGLGKNPTINRTGRLFVITGRTTFSAGLYHAAQLKQFTRAIFVGEPVGDRLDYWAEGGMIVLPNSKVAIDYANGFHRYSRNEYPKNRPYYATLNIPSLIPDTSAPLSAKDYFSGRDPALESIMEHRRH